jgi:hypothetical protein
MNDGAEYIEEYNEEEEMVESYIEEDDGEIMEQDEEEIKPIEIQEILVKTKKIKQEPRSSDVVKKLVQVKGEALLNVLNTMRDVSNLLDLLF